MANKTELCVIFGGVSSEHDISLISSAGIIDNLDYEKYNITKIGITKQGVWLLYDGGTQDIKNGSWHTKDCIPCVLSPDSRTHGIIINQNGSFVEKKIDVVFPVLHGKNGEDGTIQGLFELANIPYVGCNVLSSSICMDKAIANQLMDQNGIARCEWDYLARADFDKFDLLEPVWAEKLGYPIFVKPANAGSSIGISKAADKPALKKAIELALQYDTRIVLERFVIGQEIECAVIGNDDNAQSTLPGEILASAEFYDYDDKYVSNTSTVCIPANLSEEMLLETQKIAVAAYRALCCTGLARVDFFVEKETGKILLNEINTLPGFTPISMYPKLMIGTGIGYSELLDKLITLALLANK